jgi:uncharacterized iron-regulated membrane protein
MRHALLLICHAYSLRPVHYAASVETRGPADHPRPSDGLTPDDVAELVDFPPGWRSRVALQVEAPPAREAVTRAFYADLRKRADELGGAKKYRVDAPRGFLNVHSEPDDPFRLDNVVEQLDHGTVVTAVEERDGWVRHDMGGWSIKAHGGHAFLVPLDGDVM